MGEVRGPVCGGGVAAGSIVEACLAARTVTALHLAYACAAEARELDPDLRARLDQLLTTTPTDPDEIRLLDGAAAARALQDTHALDDDGPRICARPVSHELWNRYATRIVSGFIPLPPGPATGLWSADIQGFLDWLNGLFTDGTNYRLPTLDEAGRALRIDLYAADTVMWADATHSGDGQREARLIHRTADSHPHRPTAQQISTYHHLILNHTYLVFRLLFPRSSLTFAQLVTYGRPRDLTRPEHQLLHAIDLARALTRDLTLAHDLTFARDLDLDRTLALDRTRDHGHTRDLARDRPLDRPLDRNHALAIARAIARDLGLDRDLARALDLARVRARSLDLNLDLDLAFARAAAKSHLAQLDEVDVVILGRACLQLTHNYTRSKSPDGAAPRRRKGEETSFSAFLRDCLSAVPTWSPADDPHVALERALHIARKLGAVDTATLVESALRLAAPLWDRSRAVQQRDTVLAATLVLATLTYDEPSAPGTELAEQLRGALCALIR